MVRRVLRPRKTDDENGETKAPNETTPTPTQPAPPPTAPPAKRETATTQSTPTPVAPRPPAKSFVPAKPAPVPAPTHAPGEHLPPKGRSRDAGAMARSGVYIEQDMAGKVPKTAPLPEKHEFKPNVAAEMSFGDAAFEAFFAEEIENLVNEPAEIHNERIYAWRCQCCDILIPIPRRTEVFHGAYHLVHDDTLGVLVNGERFIPEAQGTRLEVVTPGRLRDLRGNNLGAPTIRSR